MDWRVIGNGILTQAQFKKLLQDNESPVLKEAAAVWKVIDGDAILYLSHLQRENNYGKEGISKQHPEWFNVLGTRPRGQPGFQDFDSYAANAREWKARIYDPQYAYADTDTIEEYVHKYAPSSDGNDEAGYVAHIKRNVDRYEGGAKKPLRARVPGLVLTVRKTRRPGSTPFSISTPEYTHHNTGNNVSKESEWQFFNNGGGTSAVNVHFVMDASGILQMMHLWARGVHAGNAEGNARSLAFEMRAEGDDFRVTEQHAARLIAALHVRDDRIDWSGAEHLAFNIDRGRPHRGWPGANPSCPATSIRLHGSQETEFLQEMAWDIVAKLGQDPNPVPKLQPHPIDRKLDGDHWIDDDGNEWLWFNQSFRLKRKVQAYEWASTDSRKGPLYDPDKTKTIRIKRVVAANAPTLDDPALVAPENWGLTSAGWRVLMRDLIR